MLMIGSQLIALYSLEGNPCELLSTVSGTGARLSYIFFGVSYKPTNKSRGMKSVSWYSNPSRGIQIRLVVFKSVSWYSNPSRGIQSVSWYPNQFRGI